MRYVNVSHQVTMIAYHSFIICFGSAADSNELTDDSILADLRSSIFAAEFHVIGLAADSSVVKNPASRSDTCAAMNDHACMNLHVISYGNVIFYYSEILYCYIVSYFC